jgi:hypothetical protein
MNGMMAYLPLSPAAAAALHGGQDPGPSRACAATPTFTVALGADTSPDEADFAALSQAGVLALLVDPGPQRLVLAVDVKPAQVRDLQTPTGEVEVSGLRWSQVQSLFSDEAEAATAVASAWEATKGLTELSEALAIPAVGELLDTHDLLWFGVDELDQFG